MIKSVEIVYEDEWILVALKPENLAVETRRIDEEDLESLLRKQLKKARQGTCFICQNQRGGSGSVGSA